MAVSGLEMAQDSQFYNWRREEVDSRLQGIMRSIHENCVKYGKEGEFVNYVRGANVAGFVKVANAMLAQGVVLNNFRNEHRTSQNAPRLRRLDKERRHSRTVTQRAQTRGVQRHT